MAPAASGTTHTTHGQAEQPPIDHPSCTSSLEDLTRLQEGLAAVAHNHMLAQPRACCLHMLPQLPEVARVVAVQIGNSPIAGRQAGSLQPCIVGLSSALAQLGFWQQSMATAPLQDARHAACSHAPWA